MSEMSEEAKLYKLEHQKDGKEESDPYGADIKVVGQTAADTSQHSVCGISEETPSNGIGACCGLFRFCLEGALCF